MLSRFPGMNPYLEGALWADVLHELASAIRQLIAPQLSPKYRTRIETYTIRDLDAEQEIGIFDPDVAVFLKPERSPTTTSEHLTNILTPPTTTILTTENVIEVRIPVIEIKNRLNQKLVTAIEILSLVNKRGQGLQRYREKRQSLIQTHVNLLEIDLLRRGRRAIVHPTIPRSHYLISLVQSGTAHTDIWAFGIKDRLPVLSVPVLTEDAPAQLDLNQALRLCFERGMYDLDIDYHSPPPPPSFTAEEMNWMQQLEA